MDKINGPLEGMLFDIQNNVFWLDNWGSKPDLFDKQKEIVTEYYNKYPKLIPICSHRYIPSRPLEAGNPVFSIYQMDIVYYGYNLAIYFGNEFNFSLPEIFEIPQKPKYIEFWSDQTAENQSETIENN